MKKTLSLLLALLLLVAFALSLAGCGSARREDPTQTVDITPEAGVSSGTLDFAIRLYRAAYDGNNTLLSPLSVLVALAMTANGAAGETRAQMESVLGASVEELNAFFDAYLANLPNDETCKLALADALWIRNDDRLTVKDAFLGTCADVYRAAAYRTPFDREAVDEINGWVREKTDGMIEKLVDEIPRETMMLILNALAFDAKWAEPYRQESEVRSGDFTKENGDKVKVEFLCGTERLFLEDGDRALGFVKPYAGGRYAFAALLPNSGNSVDSYLNSLTGEKISNILSNVKSDKTVVWLPKFKINYDTDLADVLQSLGMTDAFDEQYADFSGMISNTPFNPYIGSVIHKTVIDVNEIGTKAAAATSVEIKAGATPEEPKEVKLTRPFIYMLINTKTNTPFFIGTVDELK